jgi:hypothetical protein
VSRIGYSFEGEYMGMTRRNRRSEQKRKRKGKRHARK